MNFAKNYKRIFCLILCVLAVVGLCSCSKNIAEKGAEKSESTTQAALSQNSQNENVNENTSSENHERVLVAYFSCTGNTAQIASYIAEIKNADLIEIEPQKPYTSDDLSKSENSRAYIEQHSQNNDVKIKPLKISLADYDTVYIGYPIWYNKAPRAVCTFLQENDLSSKTVIAFCTSNESSIDNSVDELKALQTGAIWKSGIRFDSAETGQGVEQILQEIP